MNQCEKIVSLLIERKETVSTMESCTGGFLAHCITNISGSSSVFQFGSVTYSNEFKIKMGVSKEVIDTYTVYSMETAKEMARAICSFTRSTYGIGITGKLGKEDPKNKAGANNMIYVSIYDKEKDFYLTQTITIEDEEREECKKKVLSILFLIFLKYLKEKTSEDE